MDMQEELNNFKRNEVWSLVENPKQNVVGTKWVFHNKKDEHGVVTRNKARLMAKGYSQVEALSNELQGHFLEWSNQRGGVCGATTRL
jgi:4-diphosphocytidyl-2C-methyl-D-erythritol kinase